MQIEITPEYLAAQGLNETFPKRFWKKVRKTETCWLWTGWIRPDGYGAILRGGSDLKSIMANRASWILNVGPIPNDLCVCHHCDIRHCVNPSHLFLGTHDDNTQDMVKKGRGAKGERHGMCKLTESQVRAIKAEYVPHVVGPVFLGKKYGVHHVTICLILNGRNWKHLNSQH